MSSEQSMSPVLAASSAPWAFALGSLLHPAQALQREAKLRGVGASEAVLRELWRVGRLQPFVEIRTDPDRHRQESVDGEPRHASSWTYVLRAARDEGRLADPAERPYRGRVALDVSLDEVWKRRRIGFLYSRWQLIELRRALGSVTRLEIGADRRLRPLDEFEIGEVERARRRTALLVALESRYLPEVSSPWVHLTHATLEEWDAYKEQFDPSAALAAVGWAPEDLPWAANQLLWQASRIDPIKGRLAAVLKRTSYSSWKDLSGDALVAQDLRQAGEVVLRCHDAVKDGSRPVPDRERVHVTHERLTDRTEPLDLVLSRVGLSPHPRSVLIVEGETEELLAPRVRELIRVPADAQTMRIINARTSKGDLTKLVASLAAPVIAEAQNYPDHVQMERPPTFVLIAMDPENAYAPDKIARTVELMVDELDRLVQVQGHEVERSELEMLVTARTWTASCFEFAHFTDEELAAAIAELCPVESVDALVAALGRQRANGMDISQVWKKWRQQPSKTDLAETLWPLLETKVLAVEQDPSAAFPEIADRIVETYDLGAHLRAGSYSLTRARTASQAEVD